MLACGREYQRSLSSRLRIAQTKPPTAPARSVLLGPESLSLALVALRSAARTCESCWMLGRSPRRPWRRSPSGAGATDRPARAGLLGWLATMLEIAKPSTTAAARNVNAASQTDGVLYRRACPILVGDRMISRDSNTAWRLPRVASETRAYPVGTTARTSSDKLTSGWRVVPSRLSALTTTTWPAVEPSGAARTAITPSSISSARRDFKEFGTFACRALGRSILRWSSFRSGRPGVRRAHRGTAP